ncbi:hypothetical protein ACVWYK_004098 [Bradyrhizobium sp. USDA 4470]
MSKSSSASPETMGGEMEDHVGPAGDQLFGSTRDSKIARDGLDRETGFFRFPGLDHVMHGQFGDVALAEPAVAQQPFTQFAADHAGCAQNQDVQEPTPSYWPERAAPETS